MDNPYFSNYQLFDLVDEFVKNGGKHILLDEVHHYDKWSLVLKNIYDTFPQLKVIYTGSSLLHLTKGRADLSRRSMNYTVYGLSFREYINVTEGLSFSPYTLEEILFQHQQISSKILNEIKPIVKFKEYLMYGYYPYFLENKTNYMFKLSETINQVIEVDLPLITQINYANVNKIKQLMQIIAESVPFKPNISKLSSLIGISKNTLKDYLYYLNEALIIYMLKSGDKGDIALGKPEKIFLFHPNLMHSFSTENLNIGNLRESFFVNQLLGKHHISGTPKGDFLVDSKYIFEIGGKNKNYGQIADIDNSLIAADNLEIGYRNNIPVWLFGFLY